MIPYPNVISKWKYYLTSIPTLLFGIKNPLRTIFIFLDLYRPKRFVAELHSGVSYQVRSKMDLWVIKETCMDRDYEQSHLNIENGWTVIDVGAAFGDFSISVAKRCPTARVFSYEPFPQSRELLERNVEINRVDNLKICPFAIGSEEKTVRGSLDENGEPGDFSLINSDPVGESTLVIDFVSFEKAIKECGGACDFVKMDCEGGEFDILLNSPDESLRAVKHFALEYHDLAYPDRTHNDLTERLESLGFKVRLRPSPVRADLGFIYASRDGLSGD